MNKKALLVPGVAGAIVGAFGIGMLLSPSINNKNMGVTAEDILHSASIIDMQNCQDGEVGFDEVVGVIESATVNCLVDAFSQLGDITFRSQGAAQLALDEMLIKHYDLLRAQNPVVWHDETPTGTVYSIRVGFYAETFAYQFCDLAMQENLACKVVPVTIQ